MADPEIRIVDAEDTRRLLDPVAGGDLLNGNNAWNNFINALRSALTTPIGCTLVLSILLGLPVSSVVIGAIYLKECPAQRYIPIFLIVLGVIGGIRNLIGLCRRCRNVNQQGNCDLVHFVNLFLLGWLIAGTVWIYKITFPEYDDVTSAKYCDRTVYLYAFYLISVTYGFAVFVTLSSCCVYCCFAVTAAIN